jgi:hypothetical protein
VDTAIAAGSFKTLATALQAAGLIDTARSSRGAGRAEALPGIRQAGAAR